MLTSATCPYLPSGTTITGSGPKTSITTTQTGADGVTKLVNHTHAHGTATDQDGNVYVFNYSNYLAGLEHGGEPGVFSAPTPMRSRLRGSGPAQAAQRLHG